MNPQTVSPPTRLLVCVLLLGLAATAASAQPADVTRLEGTIIDVTGAPVPDCRVIAREADGTTVFVSAPSDAAGRYLVAVPSGGRYVIVALVNPLGSRMAMPASTPMQAGPRPVTRDIHLPVPMAPSPRHVGKELGGVDRLFLSFVEDPALPALFHVEAGIDIAEFDQGDRYGISLLGAWQPRSAPLLELGAEVLHLELEPDIGTGESGLADADVWAKLKVYHASSNKSEMALGARLTLPTGDEAVGLGRDALQSKVFLAATRAVGAGVVVGHVGVRSTEDGRAAGVPLDGTVSATAGLGLLVPLVTRDFSLVFEAEYEGERFDGLDAQSTALFGVNWRALPHGKLRAAVLAGLDDGAPDVGLRVTWAWVR